ncbi:hypothetical protein LCGC14_0395350 [marine sediment metagenome]|uniref:DUF1937 domain-containing protein n=1 Tax=marine sediment metagenome TaxID=412755 RepID=A0A0F9SYD2_9ZZZZ
MIYLASPYSSGHKIVGSEKDAMLVVRYLEVEAAVAQLIKDGEMVYSPIVHHHHLALRYKMPKDFDFWRRRDFHFIDLSEMLLVLQLIGWDISEGVTREIDYAKSKMKSIRYVVPTELKVPGFKAYREIP